MTGSEYAHLIIIIIPLYGGHEAVCDVCVLYSHKYFFLTLGCHYNVNFQFLFSVKLLKNLHVFYLHRLLRMFPLLATVVLFQASIFHWISDGPVWDAVAKATQNCRLYWWTTLLYVQNYINGVENGLVSN